MIALMRRILKISGRYRNRVIGAFFTAFFKSMFGKAPLMLSYIALAAFYNNTGSKMLCLRLGIGMLICLVLQIVFQHATDRLQSAAGFMIFADMRMKLGEHLRRMPMGYFTEGNIGKISSVLSSDMVFIEENCMTAFGDMMSYVFSQLIMIIFLLFFNVWLGLAAVVICAVIILVAQGMRKDSLRKAEIRQEQNEKLTEAVLDSQKASVSRRLTTCSVNGPPPSRRISGRPAAPALPLKKARRPGRSACSACMVWGPPLWPALLSGSTAKPLWKHRL